MAKEQILFTVEGEGEIIGGSQIGANPRAVEFGSAPVLVRSTINPGKIKLHARVLFEGEHAPTRANIEFETIPSDRTLLFLDKPIANKNTGEAYQRSFNRQLTEEERKKALDEVEKQQTEFGQ